MLEFQGILNKNKNKNKKMIKRIAVRGGGFGDEGKGKLVNLLTKNADICIRDQGGGNAGHTNEDERGRIVTHQIPSGILNHLVYNFYAAGCLLDPLRVLDEMDEFRTRGYEVSPETYGISGLAHVTLEHHLIEEKIAEASKFGVGTTLRAIGQTTSAKVNRQGIRFCEFLDSNSFKEILPPIIEAYAEKGINVSIGYLEKYKEAQEKLAPFAVRDEDIIERFKDSKWVIEGAQATMLDIDYGYYPHITTSNPSRKGIAFDFDYLLLVIKAIPSSVGTRPKITQIDEETQELFRGEKGKIDAEYGATSGRPRQLLWPDFVWAKYSVTVNEADGLAITKFDKFNLVPEIKFCTAYEFDGKRINYLPHDRIKLDRCKPIYGITLESFEQDISNIRNYSNLQKNSKTIVECFEDNLGIRVAILSVGPGKDQVIIRDRKIYNFINK